MKKILKMKKSSFPLKPWPFRGVLLDMARLTETFDYYVNLIPLLAEWGYNTIIAHMFDDEGCAIKLNSPPVLMTPNALSPEEWKKLVEIAAIHNIEIIPEIECLGHTGYLTRLPIYSGLREPPTRSGNYWSICPLHKQTLEIMENLIMMLFEIFPSKFIHIGMDEADIGGSDLCREALKSTPLWKMFGNYVLKIINICERRGRRCMMWGDHLHKNRELRKELTGHNIIICDWLYGKGHQENYRDSIIQLIDDGFEVIGSPSGCWSGTFMIPHSDNLTNIVKFDKECRNLNHPMIHGMLNTMWAPFRHLPAIVHPVVAYAGYVFSGGNNKFEDFLIDLISQKFAMPLKETGIAASSIALLHQRRFRDMLDRLIMSNEPVAHCMEKINALIDLYDRVMNKLAPLHDLVTSRHDEYEQWLFTVQFMRDMASLRANGVNSLSPDNWSCLYDRFQSACLKRRSYTGREKDEIQMGQVPLYYRNTDNPAEILTTLSEKGNFK